MCLTEQKSTDTIAWNNNASTLFNNIFYNSIQNIADRL